MIITPAKPQVGYYHYSNPDSQGALLTQTRNWPVSYAKDPTAVIHRHISGLTFEPEQIAVKVPDGLQVSDAYIDRMRDWNSAKFDAAWTQWLWKSPLNSANDEALIGFCTAYFDKKVVAVRIVYYFNVSSGYSCERFDYLYEEAA